MSCARLCAHRAEFGVFLRRHTGAHPMNLKKGRSAELADDAAAAVGVSPGDLVIHRKSSIRSLYYAGIVLGASLLLVVGFFLGLVGRDVPFSFGPEPSTMAQCMKDGLGLLDLKPPSTDALKGLVGYCYSAIRSQELLNDFTIRKLNFAQQYRANGTLMWMVVIITISGVLLAAVQLLASYQLAMAQRTALGEANELTLKRDQIVLKSSVTGLLILLVSFAFFFVFVIYVYKFQQTSDEDLQKLQAPNLPMGTLGVSPAAPKQ
jgi:hypothetical protein